MTYDESAMAVADGHWADVAPFSKFVHVHVRDLPNGEVLVVSHFGLGFGLRAVAVDMGRARVTCQFGAGSEVADYDYLGRVEEVRA